MAAHPAFAVREVVRVPGSVVSHRSLRIPDGTSHRPVRVQVAARTAAGVCGSCVSLFGGWGKTDETSTRSTGTGGGAGCCRGGGWFPRRRLESSTCREPKSTNSRDRTLALDDSGRGGGGAPKGLVHNLLVQFFTLGSSKFSKLIFLVP